MSHIEDWPVVLDGQVMRGSEATIPASDEGLIRGDGAFDAFPVRDGRPFARAAHLDRLERSCEALALPCPRAQLEGDIDVPLSRAPEGDAVVRVVLTRGGRRLCRLESPGDPAALARAVRLLRSPSPRLGRLSSLPRQVSTRLWRRARSSGRWPRAQSPDSARDADPLQPITRRCSVVTGGARGYSFLNLRSTKMAYGVVHQFTGGTEEQYQASIAAVHPSDGSLPEGQVLHVAGASADGWVIVAIHDSQQSWEQFRDSTLMPRMQAGIDGGFAGPPNETTFEVKHQDSA